MSVGVTSAIEHVLKPWPTGDAVRIEPVPFNLHHAAIEHVSLLSRNRAGRSRLGKCMVECNAGGGKLVDRVQQRLDIELAEVFAFRQVVNEITNIVGVVAEGEGK